MNKDLSQRLFEMDSTLEKLFLLDYQCAANDLAEYMTEEIEPEAIASALSLDDKWVQWFSDCDRSELPELLTELSSEKPGLVLFELSGRVYEKHPSVENCWSGTCASVVERGGCVGIENLDAAISEALDRMAPRLRREAPVKKA